MQWAREWLMGKGRAIFAGLLFYLIAHSLDFTSTAMTLAFVPGAIEGNMFATEPFTGLFSPWHLLKAKAFVGMFNIALPSALLYFGTKDDKLASIPFWYSGWKMMQVVIANFSMLYTFTHYGV